MIITKVSRWNKSKFKRAYRIRIERAFVSPCVHVECFIDSTFDGGSRLSLRSGSGLLYEHNTCTCVHTSGVAPTRPRPRPRLRTEESHLHFISSLYFYPPLLAAIRELHKAIFRRFTPPWNVNVLS